MDDDTVAGHCAALQRDGYSIMHDAIAPELCDALLEEITTMGDRWPRSLVQTFHGFQTVRYFDLLNAADVFQDIPAHPNLLGVVRGVLGVDCQLGTYGTVSIGPGEQAQVIHADDNLYRLPRPHPDMYCNVMVALSDYTAANGATRLVPGSHRWPDDPPPLRFDLAGAAGRGTELTGAGGVAPEAAGPVSWPTIAAEMPRGSACFFLGSTYHGGGANTTDAVRHGMTVAYCAAWARPQENFLVAVSQERAATFDPELQAIMGYRSSRGAVLGHTYCDDAHLSGPLAHRLALPR